MSRKQLTDAEREQMRSDAAALATAFGSLDNVALEVAKTTPINPPTKEAIRQAAKGKGGTTVARALRLAAREHLGSESTAPAQSFVEPIEGYPNRSAFLRLYWDKLSAPVREHIATYGGFDGDVLQLGRGRQIVRRRKRPGVGPSILASVVDKPKEWP